MPEREQKPQIRFKGFSDVWEQNKVSDVIEDYIEKTVAQNQYPVLTSSQQQGIVLQSEYFADRQVTTNNNVGYYVLPKGYFTYRSRSDTDIFVFNRNNIIDKGIISYYYPVFKSKNSDSNFLLRRLNYGIKRQLSMAAEGTGQKVLAHNKFKTIQINIPKYQEQIKIGTLFEHIDSLITLYQRKYEKLKNLKKSMLEKMFPKNKNKNPEIRFKGFSAPWEEHKLSSVATMHARIGWQNLRTSEFLDSGNYYLITGTDFIDGKIDLKTCHFVEKERYDQDKNIQIKNGSILITKDGTLGKVAYVEGLDKPATLNAGVFNVVIIDKNMENKYLFQYLKAPFLMDYVVKRATGGTIKHLNQNILVDFPVIHPSYEEQTKIGVFFSKLDDLIALHQRKLKMLQNIKKSCLEKMFV